LTIYDTRSASPLLDLLFEGDLVARCLVAPDGTVLRGNDAWFRSTGFSPDDVLGANIIDLFPGTRDMALSMHARARAGHRVEVPRHAQIVNGRETWWEGRIDPVPMDGGTGLLITGREGGPAVPLAPAPERYSRDGFDPAWLWALVNSVPDDVYFVDNGGTVVFVNDAVRSSLGVSDLADIHKRVGETEAMFEIYTTEGRRRRNDESPFIQAIQGRPVEGDEVVRNVMTGELRHRHYRVAPVWLDGKIAGAVSVVRDVTDFSKAVQALSEKEALLRLALDAGQMVAWDYNPTTKRVTVSAYAADLLAVGSGPVREPSNEGFLPIHPDDVDAHTTKVMEATKRGGAYVSEFRRVREDGEVIWLEERGRSVMDGFGGTRLVGITQNVTERKRAELAVRESEERLLEATHRLTVATEAARIGIYDYDVAAGMIRWDARVRELWGMGPDEPITYEAFMAGLNPDDRAATQAAVDGALDPDGSGKFRAEYRVIHRRDRKERRIEATGQGIFVDGQPSRLIGAVQDITDRKQHAEDGPDVRSPASGA
jgi:PAS domain S-box-containing protein